MRAARTAEGVEGVDRFEWSVALELAAAQRRRSDRPDLRQRDPPRFACTLAESMLG
jgi:hypothetical protein